MKKLILGLLMAFAATAEAETISNVQIGNLIYSLDTDAKTAAITGYDMSNYPTKVDVGEVEYEGQKYSVTTIGEYALLGRGITSVSLPNATTIGKSAFFGCSSLTLVSLPNATTIGEGAFCDCSLLSSVLMPKVIAIELSAFSGCGSLGSVSLPSAKTIGKKAFSGCSLTSVDLPNATTIGGYAFSGCVSLASVSLLAAETIGKYAFSDCNALSSLFVNAEMKALIEMSDRGTYGLSDSVEIIGVEGAVKFVPEGSVVVPKEQVIQEGEIAVKKESIAAPSAGTVKVEDGKVQLGVAVLKTSDLTAEKKDWGKVKLTKEDIDVDADGNIIVNVPVDSQSGFMVIQTKDAKIGD